VVYKADGVKERGKEKREKMSGGGLRKFKSNTFGGARGENVKRGGGRRFFLAG